MDGLVSLPFCLCVPPSITYTTAKCHEEREVNLTHTHTHNRLSTASCRHAYVNCRGRVNVCFCVSIGLTDFRGIGIWPQERMQHREGHHVFTFLHSCAIEKILPHVFKMYGVWGIHMEVVYLPCDWKTWLQKLRVMLLIQAVLIHILCVNKAIHLACIYIKTHLLLGDLNPSLLCGIWHQSLKPHTKEIIK